MSCTVPEDAVSQDSILSLGGDTLEDTGMAKCSPFATKVSMVVREVPARTFSSGNVLCDHIRHGTTKCLNFAF
jgi:hypothetical protein